MPAVTVTTTEGLAAALAAIDIDDPRMATRRSHCQACPKNHGLTDDTIACDCRKCQAKSLKTWACPDGHFPALVQVTTPAAAAEIFTPSATGLKLGPEKLAALGNNRAACYACPHHAGDQCGKQTAAIAECAAHGACPLPPGQGLPHRPLTIRQTFKGSIMHQVVLDHPPAASPAKPVALPVLTFPVPIHSPEWEANIKACRNGGTHGVGVITERACQYHDREQEICGKSGKACNHHALYGTCPTGRQPYRVDGLPIDKGSPTVNRNQPTVPRGCVEYKNATGSSITLRNHYRGRSVFLLTGGPSLANFDFSILKVPGVMTMAINNAAALYRPNLWVGSDEAHHFLMSIFTDPQITKFYSASRNRDRLFDSVQGHLTDMKVGDCPNIFGLMKSDEYSRDNWLDTPRIAWGPNRTTMAVALRVLYDLGFAHIFLIGCDWHMSPEKAYGFDQSKDAGAARTNNDKFATWGRRFAELQPLMEKRGFRVFNCTPGSKLDAFPRMSITDAIAIAAKEIVVHPSDEDVTNLYTSDKKSTTEFLPSSTPLVGMATFRHGGHMGDMIYGLPAIRAAGGGTLVMHAHPRGKFNQQQCDLIRPLLVAQSYIDDVVFDNRRDGFDLNGNRYGPSRQNIAERHLKIVGHPVSLKNQPWLIAPEPKKVARVVFHRSPRYHNDKFPWKRVFEKYGKDAVMVGLPFEHEQFCREVGRVPYLPTKDYLELANVLAGCELFVGNQSSPYAVAEGMKINTIQEVCPRIANCIFDRSNAVYGWNESISLPTLSRPKSYFAQHGEDRWLDEMWETLNLPTRGTFVEVGVGDGVHISNTLWLESCGWSGLLIEPDARHHASIRKNRAAILDDSAVGGRDRAFVLTQNPELSGFNRNDGQRIDVNVHRLDHLLERYSITSVDVLSIDTEGTELEVWETLDTKNYRPKVVFVEWNTIGQPANADKIVSTLSGSGYKLIAKLGGNLVFVPTH